MDLGFIGLGIMGRPMAGHLMAAGHKLYLNTRSGVPREMIEKGGVGCATAREVAQRAEIIFIMVPDTPDVDKVLFAEEGVAMVEDPAVVMAVAVDESGREGKSVRIDHAISRHIGRPRSDHIDLSIDDPHVSLTRGRARAIHDHRVRDHDGLRASGRRKTGERGAGHDRCVDSHSG